MSLMKVSGGAMILRNIHRNTLLQTTAAQTFSSISTPPPEGASEGVAEKAKQTMDNVLGAAKDTTQKLKDRVMGTGGNTAKPSSNPDLNHGVQPTDSACEDVRDRPGGYS